MPLQAGMMLTLISHLCTSPLIRFPTVVKLYSFEQVTLPVKETVQMSQSAGTDETRTFEGWSLRMSAF